MAEQEMAREEWPEFCRQFSLQHQGWLVTIHEKYPSGLVSVTLIEDEELWGIAAQEEHTKWQISIIAGEDPDRLTHLIHEPARLILEKAEDGAHKGIRVESSGGLQTEILFRTPADPMAVEGLSEAELMTMP